MANKANIKKRFDELGEQLRELEATKTHEKSEMGSGDYVDNNLLLGWKVKVKSLMSVLCGADSEYYRQFEKGEKPSFITTNYAIMLSLKAVFVAFHQDFEGGYLNSYRNLVQAEVFDSELEQAKELLASHYGSTAAVVAGIVLETTIRQLCLDQGISVGKLDKMNADLARAGVYNIQTQKRLTQLADIRNNAAHGKSDQFTDADVADMISYIERFIGEHLV